MRRPHLLTFLSALIALSAGCTEAPDTADGPGGAAADEGSLSIAVRTDALNLDTIPNLEMRLLVYPYRATEPTLTLSHEVGPLIPFEVHLPAEHYDLTAEVYDQQTSEVLYRGSASDVEVIVGHTTSLTLALEQSGSVRILIDLGGGGKHFEPVSHSVHPAGPAHGRGAVARNWDAEGVEEVAYVRLRSDWPYSEGFVAADPDALDALTQRSFTEVVPGVTATSTPVDISLAYAGDDLLLLKAGTSALSLYRAPLGASGGELISTIPFERRKVGDVQIGTRWLKEGAFPTLESCALEVRDSLRVVCVIRLASRWSSTGDVEGVIETESTDGGISWSPFPAYANALTTVPTLLLDPWYLPTSWGSSYGDGLALLTEGGVTRLYVGHRSRDYGSATTSFEVLLYSSLDWTSWTDATPVFSMDSSVSGATTVVGSLLGVFRQPPAPPRSAQWHLYVGRSSADGSVEALWHMTSE